MKKRITFTAFVEWPVDEAPTEEEMALCLIEIMSQDSHYNDDSFKVETVGSKLSEVETQPDGCFTFHVTYYYLASGMEGRADTRDYGYVRALDQVEAKKIVASATTSSESDANWVIGCLTATPIKGSFRMSDR